MELPFLKGIFPEQFEKICNEFGCEIVESDSEHVIVRFKKYCLELDMQLKDDSGDLLVGVVSFKGIDFDTTSISEILKFFKNIDDFQEKIANWNS